MKSFLKHIYVFLQSCTNILHKSQRMKTKVVPYSPNDWNNVEMRIRVMPVAPFLFLLIGRESSTIITYVSNSYTGLKTRLNSLA